MSIKTLRKRIALVAVSALGAGFMSVVAVPSANATLAAGEMTVYANASTGAAGAVTATPTATNGNSQGLLTQSDTGAAIGGANQLTQTATVRLDGTVAVGFKPATGKYALIAVVGGTITSASSSNTAVINTGGTAAYTVTQDGTVAIVAKPSAAGTMVIAAYSGDSAASTTTLSSKVTVTVVASGASYGVVSAADSTAYWGATSSATSDTSTTDVASSNSNKENNGIATGTLELLDVYGNTVASSSGLLTCSVTGGAVCNISATRTSGITAGSNASAFATHTAAKNYFSVSQGTANAPAKGTLTLKYNDTVIATKSFTIKGTVAKLIVSGVGIGRTATNSADNFLYTAQDSAGNTVYLTSTSQVTVRPTTTNEAVTAAVISQLETSSQLGKGNFTCSGASGTAGITVNGAKADLQLRIADASGVYIYSNVFTARCGGDARAFTASLDKAVYAPGEVATLTFNFLDTAGNKANDFTDITNNTAANVATYVGAPGTVVTAAAAGDKPLDGVKTYKFIVGTTEGSFNMVADAPYVRAQNIALGGSQAAITIPYTIKASTTAVTNAEVLAAIVKLIASINKQIRALQKSLRR